MPENSKYYSAALKHWIDKRGTGATKELFINSGVSMPLISEIKNGKKYGSEDSREKISVAIGYNTIEEMINFGKSLIDQAQPTPTARDGTNPPTTMILLYDLFKSLEKKLDSLDISVHAMWDKYNNHEKEHKADLAQIGDRLNDVDTRLSQIRADMSEAAKTQDITCLGRIGEPGR